MGEGSECLVVEFWCGVSDRREMAKTIIQAIGWVLSMGSWGAAVGVILSHKWKSNSQEGLHHSALDTISNIAGLWDSCQVFPSGQKQCTPISGPLSSLSPVIVACRSLLVFAILNGFVAGLLTLLGFKCTEIGPDSRRTKEKLASLSGVMFLVSAMCTIAAACWFMVDVMTSPPPIGPRNDVLAYSVSEATQICLAFGLLWFIGSIFVIVGSRQERPEDNDVTSKFDPRFKVKQEYI